MVGEVGLEEERVGEQDCGVWNVGEDGMTVWANASAAALCASVWMASSPPTCVGRERRSVSPPASPFHSLPVSHLELRVIPRLTKLAHSRHQIHVELGHGLFQLTLQKPSELLQQEEDG